jgi:hypothetical protein
MDPSQLEALRRNSGLSLTREGLFVYHGSPVENSRVQAMFHRGLRVLSSGEVTLSVGAQWAYVRCEGVARFAEGLEPIGSTLELRLRGDERVRCRDPRIAFGPDDRVYVWEAPELPPAILTRAAHGRLVERVDVGDDGAPRYNHGQLSLPLETLARAPGPADPFDEVRQGPTV